ncbi:MAG: hypothetical protein IPP15_06160 [Saprospiraceae bacterium]|uniref:Transcription elongation factor GreA/GreB C-terminal domain-containing protein n=1 Tax=Candidatus Opimibacter skivensis TaxID=2982028 RepID=A0A9D7XN99_9BACT|nr:hypothetical protein [Candidatus Opimibacter skivensis]
MKKQEILKQVIHQMENNIAEIRTSLQDYEAASDIDEGDTSDPENFSQQSEQKEMQYQMQIQLDSAQSSLIELKDFLGKEYSVAKAGALIETETNYFFLGVSFPALHIGEKELLGISAESPAYGVINGKSKGGSFQLGKNKHSILGIS